MVHTYLKNKQTKKHPILYENESKYTRNSRIQTPKISGKKVDRQHKINKFK